MDLQAVKMGRLALVTLVVSALLCSAVFLIGSRQRVWQPLPATGSNAAIGPEQMAPPLAPNNPATNQAASDVSRFHATPWLLPPNSSALAWTGIHDLDTLMEMRCTPFGDHKAVTFLLFNKPYAIMAQHSSE